jgi:hypothetical protein
MPSLIYKDFGVTNAKNFSQMISLPLANVYVMLSRTVPWPNVSNTNLLDDVTIEKPNDTTDYRYKVSRDGVIMKRLTDNDIHPVIPRVDWANTTIYAAYDQTLNVFTKNVATQISGGNVNVSSSNTVFANGINLSSVSANLTVGGLIRIGEETKEIHFITPNGSFLYVNTNFSSAYTSANLFKVSTSDVQYYNKFYVRNTYDQVFKCLDNNANGQSTIMPEITIGGQLPENPFIETGDGYKWKYMYTITSGLKNKFFTNKFMPVVEESIVFDNTRNGRIDIVRILSGGTGYYAGGSVNNYAIGTITGDGTSANVTVDVASGVINDVNIVNGGNNYTTATFTVDDPLQTTIGEEASFRVVVSPQYGHGSSVARELGASYRMISLDFEGDLEGNYPIVNTDEDSIRQISIVKDPKYASNGVFATQTYLPMYTLVYTSTPASGSDFSENSEVYVGNSYDNAIFKARVVHFNNTDNILYLNNISGNVDAILSEQITQKDFPSITSTIYSVAKPDINIFSGEMFYVENRAPIYRSTEQTETVKLVIEF